MDMVQILSKYKSKTHFIRSYKDQGYIVPDYRDISWVYVRKVLEGRKLLAKKTGDKLIIPPKTTDFFT